MHESCCDYFSFALLFFLIDNVLAMRNLPCLGVASGNGLGGIGGKAAATAAMEAADATTASQPPHSTSSYFTTTYYHLTDDECMFLVSSQLFQSPFRTKPMFVYSTSKLDTKDPSLRNKFIINF